MKKKDLKTLIKDNKEAVVLFACNVGLVGLSLIAINELKKTKHDLAQSQWQCFLLNDENQRLLHFIDEE